MAGPGAGGDEILSSAAPSLSDDRVKEFERIYNEMVDDVFRYALSCVGRREIAEEIAADVFLALYRNIAGVDREWVRPWMFRVAKNHATDYWRRRWTEQRLASEAPPAATAEPGEAGWLLDNTDLKPSHRACLLLRYVHGMERDEISKVTGLTANQVKSCLQYGLQLLRKQFKKGKAK